MSGPEYLLDNRAAQARKRFDALSAIFDPVGFTPRVELQLHNVVSDAPLEGGFDLVDVLEHANMSQVSADLIATGGVSQYEIDAFLASLTNDELDLATAPLVSASARRPASVVEIQ